MTKEHGAQRIKAVRFVVHPGYKPNEGPAKKGINDIAVIELERTPDVNARVRPAALANEYNLKDVSKLYMYGQTNHLKSSLSGRRQMWRWMWRWI